MKSPKAPPPPVPPPPPAPPPQVDEAREQAGERDRIRKRRGRAATLLAGEGGDSPQTATKHLTGE